MKRSPILGFVLLSLFVLAVAPPIALAADYRKVGVKVGDTADYNGSMGSASAELRMHIMQIVGTTVTLQFNGLNPDGSETTGYNLTGDIATGSRGIYVFLVVPNLAQGDSILSSPFPGFTIDKEATMTVAGVGRSVIHFGISTDSLGVDVYWDKLTGLAVKIDETLSGTHITLDMISTTAFEGIAVDPVILLAIGGGVAGVAAVLIVAGVVTQRRRQAESASEHTSEVQSAQVLHTICAHSFL